LFISRRTLWNHYYRISRKLGARNIRDALRILQTEPLEQAMHTLRLSPRGREVFMLIREGLNNKGISERLGMGISGVKRHKEKMLLQNKCSTMLELIAKHHGMGSE
jgi:DNA-binding CsgD family transcriptional regulator